MDLKKTGKKSLSITDHSDWPWRVKPLNQASTESSDKKPSISLGPQRSPHCAAPVSSPGLDEVNSSGPHKQSGKARTSRKTKRFQSRLAKLRKHHEDCYERFNRAEIENECNTIAKQLSQKDCLSSLVTSTTDASSSSPPCAVSTSVMTSSPSPYYRLPEGTLQLAKMSKVLMAMEKGTLSDFKGKKLDNIEIDPNEQLEAQGDSMSSDEEGLQFFKCSKKWEDNEVKAVERHMMEFIKTCKFLVKMKECKAVIRPDVRLPLLWSGACEERVGDLCSAVSHYTEITHTVIQEKIPPDEAASLTPRKHPERLLHAKSSSASKALRTEHACPHPIIPF
ncbi:uncharacterized protein [Chanodichthys erythropterus]|uniref:uncharacterized protein n=1 Tax=Chanodichthys erythropterus TaxID=933992 RepID=UPI00351EDF04